MSGLPVTGFMTLPFGWDRDQVDAPEPAEAIR